MRFWRCCVWGNVSTCEKNYIEAQYQFDNFRRLHPSHEQVDYSMFMAGMCQFKQVLEFDRDQTAARAAVTSLTCCWRLFPIVPIQAWPYAR